MGLSEVAKTYKDLTLSIDRNEGKGGGRTLEVTLWGERPGGGVACLFNRIGPDVGLTCDEIAEEFERALGVPDGWVGVSEWVDGKEVTP